MRLGLGVGLGTMRPGPFSPSTISGLVLWLDAARGVGLGAGSNVATWADQAGVQAAPNQGTGANQPTIVTSAINGRPAVAFTGAQFFAHALVLPPPFTIVAVAFTNAVDAAFHGIGTFSGGVGGAALFARSGTVQQWGIYANAEADSGQSLTTFKKVVAVGRAYNDIDLRTNGASVTVSTGVSAFVAASVIGCLQGGGVQCLEGSIAELLCYSRALTVAECQKVESYLAGKYAI